MEPVIAFAPSLRRNMTSGTTCPFRRFVEFLRGFTFFPEKYAPMRSIVRTFDITITTMDYFVRCDTTQVTNESLRHVLYTGEAGRTQIRLLMCKHDRYGFETATLLDLRYVTITESRYDLRNNPTRERGGKETGAFLPSLLVWLTFSALRPTNDGRVLGLDAKVTLDSKCGPCCGEQRDTSTKLRLVVNVWQLFNMELACSGRISFPVMCVLFNASWNTCSSTGCTKGVRTSPGAMPLTRTFIAAPSTAPYLT